MHNIRTQHTYRNLAHIHTQKHSCITYIAYITDIRTYIRTPMRLYRTHITYIYTSHTHHTRVPNIHSAQTTRTQYTYVKTSHTYHTYVLYHTQHNATYPTNIHTHANITQMHIVQTYIEHIHNIHKHITYIHNIHTYIYTNITYRTDLHT